MRRELSSKFTPLYRWVIPALLTIAAIVVVWRLARIGMPDRPDTAAVLLAVMLAVLLMFVARVFDRAKRIWIDGAMLIVSDYRREVSVALGAIESVEATPFMKPGRVRLRFKRPTIFGDSIVFFPASGADVNRRLTRGAG